ncbi:hypothetical protein [Gilvimarinus polysaccharolyticus]|uniref:hypothetical protein n=1 Tax=Gilvimarinus polysaccharolyticus TaxID=863921 RepID=UPI000673ACBF|nr:hypothetical protein [Gilvimarinus polysaccharolyticus]
MHTTHDTSLPNIEQDDDAREPISTPRSAMPAWFKVGLVAVLLLVLAAFVGLVFFFPSSDNGDKPADPSQLPAERVLVPEPPITIQPTNTDNIDSDLVSPLLRLDASDDLYSESVVLETNSAVQKELEDDIDSVKDSVKVIQGALMELQAQLSEMRETDNDNASDINNLRRSFFDFKEDHKASTPLKNPELPFAVIAIKQIGTLVQVSVTNNGERRDLGLNSRWMDWKLTGVDLTGRRVQFTHKDQITRLTVSI